MKSGSILALFFVCAPHHSQRVGVGKSVPPDTLQQIIRARRQAPAFPGRPATICPGAGKLEEKRGEDNERTGLSSPFVVLWPKGCGPANANSLKGLSGLLNSMIFFNDFTHTILKLFYLSVGVSVFLAESV